MLPGSQQFCKRAASIIPHKVIFVSGQFLVTIALLEPKRIGYSVLSVIFYDLYAMCCF
jgi:hypothetical protein